LLNSTWTRASHAWASVTPVVLDRFPKASRRENRRQWEAEVRQIITSSCRLSGLPEPLEVDLDTTSWHIGIPRAFAKSHPLRGSTFDDRQHKSVGDGFPAMPSRPGKPARPQIHVYLRFAVPVIGPILLGAGRYFGYGMCKPIE
jgi:CRISPR-associated protein Csb2